MEHGSALSLALIPMATEPTAVARANNEITDIQNIF